MIQTSALNTIFLHSPVNFLGFCLLRHSSAWNQNGQLDDRCTDALQH